MKHTFVLFFLILAALSLAACGGQAAEAKDASTVSLQVDAHDTLDFTLDTTTIPAGADVSLTLHNDGKLNHNFAIVHSDVDLFTVSESNVVADINTGIVAGGDTSQLTFTAPPAGTYTFVCLVPGHAAGGMTGTLTVTQPDMTLAN